MSSESMGLSPAADWPKKSGRKSGTGGAGIAVRVSNLSKCYQIYDRPIDRLKQTLWRGRKRYYREFWALRGISFDVRKGETLGIIGRNGSGKSTVLHLLCGTHGASTGEVAVCGRVAALLELGAGFNPEFTGRENVYMNAAILGLTQKEVDSKYREIVEFADIGEFVDQPVKTYSSGMYVRLAFAVAVSVDPEILVVDEALSVGDTAFRNKCIERIKGLQRSGTSIIFVSHDLSTLQLICDRVLWLDAGRMKAIGNPVAVCQEYYVSTTGGAGDMCQAPQRAVPQQNTGMARFTEASLHLGAHQVRPLYQIGEEVRFRFSLEAIRELGPVVFAISIYRADGDWLVGQTSREERVVWPACKAGDILRGSFALRPNYLGPGEYIGAFGAYSEDHSLCYALTELNISFSVRSSFPIWGKLYHPCGWVNTDTGNRDG